MDPNFKAESERQQRKMLEKMSTILNKLESMKHQLKDVSTKAYESEMKEQKHIKFCAPWSFKKKSYEQQHKKRKSQSHLDSS